MTSRVTANRYYTGHSSCLKIRSHQMQCVALRCHSVPRCTASGVKEPLQLHSRSTQLKFKLTDFYRAMQYSSKCGLEIACRLSVCL